MELTYLNQSSDRDGTWGLIGSKRSGGHTKLGSGCKPVHIFTNRENASTNIRGRVLWVILWQFAHLIAKSPNLVPVRGSKEQQRAPQDYFFFCLSFAQSKIVAPSMRKAIPSGGKMNSHITPSPVNPLPNPT